MSLSLKKDLVKPYGGYFWGWQVLGFLLPIGGLLFFIYGLIWCKTVEPFEHDLEPLFNEEMGAFTKKGNAINAAPESEASAEGTEKVE